jgi:hypothetical protein
MKARWKILLGLVVLVGIGVLIPVIHHYQLKAEVAKFRAQLKAAGEPMELAEVIPPPVPEESEASDLLQKAAARLHTYDTFLSTNPPYAMRAISPGRAMIRWQQLDIRHTDATNSWADLAEALTMDTNAIALLRQIPDGALFDFRINYSDGILKMKFSPLASVKKSAQELEYSACLELHNGDGGAAIADNSVMISLSEAMVHDRLLISELVRIAIARIAVATTWEILQATNLPEAGLAQLQNKWARISFLDSYENAICLERAANNVDIVEMRESNLGDYFDIRQKLNLSALASGDASFWAAARGRHQVFMWRYFWSYPDEMRALQGTQYLLRASRAARTNGCWLTAISTQSKQIETLKIPTDELSQFLLDADKTDFHYLLSSSIVTSSGILGRAMLAEVAARITTTAIALKRYQQQKGSYPQELSLLVPDFLAAVPNDPVDGKPLRYRLQAYGTFRLYSIGENGVDDGGEVSIGQDTGETVPSWLDKKALDWVWPQPATAEEIQAYYLKQAQKRK